MKIQIISDIHMEFHADGGADFISRLSHADVLVVAGDLCSYRQLPATLRKLCDAFEHVVYVLGNHESYGATIEDSRERVRATKTSFANAEVGRVKPPNLHFLDNSVATINGQRFLGGTLWFRDTPDNFRYEINLDDFSQIREIQVSVYEENARTVDFLNTNVRAGDIVVTHHLPTMASVSSRYKSSQTNRFFVCDMDDLIFDAKPKVWIHGHTHDSKDYMHGDTRILCNPFGYVGREINGEYCEDKILEI